jgi:hypothetical protein
MSGDLKAVREDDNSQLRVNWPSASANSPSHKRETNGSRRARTGCGACRSFQDDCDPQKEDLRACTWPHLPFNFLLLQSAWSAEALAEIIFEYYDALPPGAWPNWVLGNHDNTRIATRIGSRQAWIAAMLH